MAVCSRCNGNGKLSEENYCDCVDGQMQKRLDRGKRQAARAKEAQMKVEAETTAKATKAKKKKVDKPEQMALFEEVVPFKPFDWVVGISGGYEGVIGVALEVDAKKRMVYVQAHKTKSGRELAGKSWFAFRELEVLPTSIEEDDLLAMIDLALDRKDEEWFEQLTTNLHIAMGGC